MDIEIDLQEIADYVKSTKFAEFLLETAPSFECAAFVLQTLLNSVDEAALSVDNLNNI